MSRRFHLVLVGGCAILAAISAQPAGVVLAQAMRGPYAELPRNGREALEGASLGPEARADTPRPAAKSAVPDGGL